MKILVDLQGAQTESRFRGIGRYSMSLAKAMARQCRDHELWICVNAALPESIAEIRGQFEGLISPARIQVFESLGSVGWPDSANRWRRDTAELMRESFIASLRPDIVHVSSLFEGSQCTAVTSIGKLAGGPASTVTLYDLIPLLNQEKYLTSAWTRDWYLDKVASLLRADLLLSISNYAKKEAIDALGIDAGRIVNISSAVSDHFVPTTVGPVQWDFLHKRFGLNGPFFMYSGAMEPRKNAERLFEAFSMLPAGVRERHQLVLAGKVAPHDLKRLEQLAADLGIKDRIVLTGYVIEDELVILYNAAALYVFPSLHEGFGLPALEAMSCGTPTIGSATTSVPEVVGRADALFDPADASAIAAAMERGICDREFNASLRQHALEQSAKFSWDASARRAIEGFERLHPNESSSKQAWPATAAWLRAGYEILVGGIGSLPRADVPVSEQDLAEASVAIASNLRRVESLERAGPLPTIISWRMEGPFDSSYSLALVNRELAVAMSALGHDVALHSTEGPGDFLPDPGFLDSHPDLQLLYERSESLLPVQAEVSSRLLYPPRVSDMSSRVNMLHSYAWEESGFPLKWVEDFNESLQGISCLSTHVEKIMIDNGVSVPLSIGSCGVDHWDRVVADASYAAPGKSFRFLHVSSCFPRKGADVLIEAFGRAFGKSDDVSLIIKTFDNPHNQVKQWLAQAGAGKEDFPEVIVIEEDISESQLKALYESCHALVAPSRAEGFGLPLAEAMLSGLPVITTGWGGQLDFCSPRTAWLIDYKFAPAETHFAIFGSVWAEPDKDSLAETLREVRNLTHQDRVARTAAAKELLRSRFKWSDVAHNQVASANRFAEAGEPSLPRVGWVSTWNAKCGIATYSANLVAGLRNEIKVFAPVTDQLIEMDGENIQRCWVSGDSDELQKLAEAIDAFDPEVVVIQFQYSFFNFNALDKLIASQEEKGRSVVVMLHATIDSSLTPRKRIARLADAFRKCDRVLVHTHHDMNNLKAIGVVDNVALFPHGVMDWPEPAVRPEGEPFTIASYGFLLPHKGLLELVDAVGILVARNANVRLKMINAEYPSEESRSLAALVAQRIAGSALGTSVSVCTDYLSDEESIGALTESDLVCFPIKAPASPPVRQCATVWPLAGRLR